MPIRIALAGNPNCGKTTMFNSLTGSNQFVGNWPGVTVEKKEGKLKGQRVWESEHKPHHHHEGHHLGDQHHENHHYENRHGFDSPQPKDVIVTDLPGIYSLSPYTLEEVVTRDYLISEHPDVILNIVDASNIERNLYLTTQLLEIGIPVVIALNMMDVVKKRGDKIDIGRLSEILGCQIVLTSAVKGEGCLIAARAAISKVGSPTAQNRVFSKAIEKQLREIEVLIADKAPSESLRWFAVKVFERDGKVLKHLHLTETLLGRIESTITEAERVYDDDAESIITNERYDYITRVVSDSVIKNEEGLSSSDKIDRILTHRVFALPIFAVIMFMIYYIAVTTVGSVVTDFMNDTLFDKWISVPLAAWLESAGVADILSSLLVDGVLAGVGAVLGFVPQMLILFFLLSVLEDCGYMSRVAFIMDKLFRHFGLSGKSFIPLLIGTGCSVPGIMASRTIDQERDRRMTIITTSFIPCGAKMPIIALIAATMFGNAAWVAPSAYFIGIAAVVISGLILKKTKLFVGDPAPFVMELPLYHLPTIKNVLRGTWERGWSFIKKAGTVILLASVFVWFASNFGFEGGRFGMVGDMDKSVLAAAGGVIAPIFQPLGFGNWQSSVATILGLMAKEEVVGAFGILFGNGDIAGDLPTLAASFTALSAYSFLIFNLLCAPCVAAVGAIKREMNSWKWTLFAVGYQTVFAYAVSLIVYQFGLFFSRGVLGAGTLVAVACLGVMVWLVVRRTPNHAPPAGGLY